MFIFFLFMSCPSFIVQNVPRCYFYPMIELVKEDENLFNTMDHKCGKVEEFCKILRKIIFLQPEEKEVLTLTKN